MTEAEIAAFFRQRIKAAKAAGKQASVPTVVRGNVTELSEASIVQQGRESVGLQ